MAQIKRMVYEQEVPDFFFEIPAKIYGDTLIKPVENPVAVAALFAIESERNDIVIYTDEQHIRLTGIFPHHEDTAYFGFWESTDDVELNGYAFQLLEQDAKARNKKTITGPINFSTFNANRLRKGGAPSWGMFDKEPVNPGYYSGLLIQAGFQELLTYESRLVQKEALAGLNTGKSSFIETLNQIPFNFIPLNKGSWARYEHEIYELIHVIFSENPFYRAISEDQFKLIYDHKFVAKLCPHSSVLFEEKTTGKLVAVCLCQPNYQSLYPDVSAPDFEHDYPKLQHKTLLARTIGVHPAYRKQGLMNYIGAYGLLAIRDYYDDLIVSLMRADNYSTHFTNYVNYESVQYALYQKAIEGKA